MSLNIQNIYRIKNFISNEESKFFINYINNSSSFNEKHTRCLGHPKESDNCYEQYVNYSKKVLEKVSFIFGKSLAIFRDIDFRKWYPGEYQDPHSDCEAKFYLDKNNQPLMTPINNFSSIFIEYAALCYLNENYVGGEIFFPDYDLSIKPGVGELIVFPGTEYYIHGVSEVKSGNRFVINSFFTTPKLMYIWKHFVQCDDTIYYQEISELNDNKKIFTINNIPESFGNF